MGTDISLSYALLFFFAFPQLYKYVKFIPSLQAVPKQMMSQIWPTSYRFPTPSLNDKRMANPKYSLCTSLSFFSLKHDSVTGENILSSHVDKKRKPEKTARQMWELCS